MTGIPFMKQRLPSVGNIVEVIRTMPYHVERCRYIGRTGSHILNEVWIDVLGIWVQLDGSAYSGDLGRGYRYPGWIDRWRLRRALRNWQKWHEPKGTRID